MALIEKIENKFKIVFWGMIVIGVTAVCICIGCFFFTYIMIQQERQKIYVLDSSYTPLVADRTDEYINAEVEMKADITLFHNLFFTLPPDNTYIKSSINQAIQLCGDGNAMQQYLNYQEQGFYTKLIQTSSVSTIMTDSIKVNQATGYFRYFGKQKIARASTTRLLRLETEGYIKKAIRSEKNPHGLLINKWIVTNNTVIRDSRNENAVATTSDNDAGEFSQTDEPYDEE